MLLLELIWDNVNPEVVQSAYGYLLFDDTVLDKRYSRKIELVRRQYSGNAHGIISGIGVVTCVYVNPELDKFWLIDIIFAPDIDGKTKLDHVEDILTDAIKIKKLLLKTILMDSWYATKDLMLLIEGYRKIYYCPLKINRLADDSAGIGKYKAIGDLSWSETELNSGKIVKLHKFPKDHKVKLFKVPVSTNRIDYVATNDLSQDSTKTVRDECSIRWKTKEFHREAKQITGIELCQARQGRIQRNHIICAILVWVRLKNLPMIQAKQFILSKTICFRNI